MPLLRCTEPECQHQFFRASHLAEDCDCEECGAPTEPVEVDDQPPAELAPSVRATPGGPHPAHARKRARQILSQYEVTAPPVPVVEIAQQQGFVVRQADLGGLRARLLDNVIEVSADEPPVAQRFSVGHELGHHFLGTGHGDDQSVEAEADAFAGELLVPGFMLNAAVATETRPRVLARTFEVSPRALQVAAQIHRLDGLLS